MGLLQVLWLRHQDEYLLLRSLDREVPVWYTREASREDRHNMTVQNVESKVSYVGDGTIVTFSFNFRVDDVSWVLVSFTDFMTGVSLNLDQDSSPGGTVNYSTAPPSAQDIDISRVIPVTQNTDYTRYNAFDSESHEKALDKVTMLVQDEHRLTFRGLGAPEGVVTALIGSTFHREDGGAGTSFYVKESGTGNTGWVAK